MNKTPLVRPSRTLRSPFQGELEGAERPFDPALALLVPVNRYLEPRVGIVTFDVGLCAELDSESVKI